MNMIGIKITPLSRVNVTRICVADRHKIMNDKLNALPMAIHICTAEK